MSQQQQQQVDDLDDLDSLLDELEDDVLSKPPGSGVIEANQTDAKSEAEDEEKTTNKTNTTLEDDFKTMMKEIQSTDPALASQLNDFVKDLESGDSDDNTSKQQQQASTNGKNKDFQDIVSDTINRLKTSGEDVDKQVKEEQAGGDPISQLLKQLGDLEMDGDGDDDEDGGIGGGGFGDVLMDMLSQLTSKNVLYEPLKDLHTKFPSWLEANKGVIPEKDHKNYSDQYAIVNEIILKFEDENYHDKVDSEFINVKLEKLQDLGMPPEEIMNSELGGIPGFNNKDTNEFNNDEIPKDIEKQLQEGCKQT